LQSAYLMLNELKDFQKKKKKTGLSRLFEVEMKIKKLEIKNDDFKPYLDNLNSLLTEHNHDVKLQNKS